MSGLFRVDPGLLRLEQELSRDLGKGGKVDSRNKLKRMLGSRLLYYFNGASQDDPETFNQSVPRPTYRKCPLFYEYFTKSLSLL